MEENNKNNNYYRKLNTMLLSNITNFSLKCADIILSYITSYFTLAPTKFQDWLHSTYSTLDRKNYWAKEALDDFIYYRTVVNFFMIDSEYGTKKYFSHCYKYPLVEKRQCIDVEFKEVLDVWNHQDDIIKYCFILVSFIDKVNKINKVNNTAKEQGIEVENANVEIEEIQELKKPSAEIEELKELKRTKQSNTKAKEAGEIFGLIKIGHYRFDKKIFIDILCAATIEQIYTHCKAVERRIEKSKIKAIDADDYGFSWVKFKFSPFGVDNPYANPYDIPDARLITEFIGHDTITPLIERIYYYKPYGHSSVYVARLKDGRYAAYDYECHRIHYSLASAVEASCGMYAFRKYRPP